MDWRRLAIHVLYQLVALGATGARLAASGQHGGEPAADSAAAVAANSTGFVLEHCANRLDFKSIADFQRFSGALVDQHEKQLEAQLLLQGDPTLASCLQSRDSILELSALVGGYDKLRPCKYSEIQKLEDYAKRHFFAASSGGGGGGRGRGTKTTTTTKSPPPTLKFFTLFGVNVGLHCKLNLLAHLKQADLEADQLDFIYSIASPTGWSVLVNEHTKKSMKFGGSTHATSQLINKLVRLVPGLTQVEQLDYLNFNHVQDELSRRASWNGREAGQYELEEASGGAGMRAKLVAAVEQVIGSCKSLDQFYVNSLLSLAKLVELGLGGVNYLNEFHESSLLLHKWLAAASFCQLMARVRLVGGGGGSGGGERTATTNDGTTIDFELIHDDKQLESRRELYSYVARMEEIGEVAREAAWRASVPAGQWRQKSEAMFQGNETTTSRALKQVKQFFRGLERGFQAGLE